MTRILPGLKKYSDLLIVFFTCLITIATFLLWDVSRKQKEYTYLMGKVSVQPIIQTNYIEETLHNFTRRHDLGSMVGKGMEIRTIQVSNIGRGPAYNLRFEHRGRETEKIKILQVGQTHEYFIQLEEIKSGKISPFVKITYQDAFENEYTIED